MLSDEWLSRYGLLENFNASVTRTRTGTRTGTGTGTWTTGVTAIALCTSCSRAKNETHVTSPYHIWVHVDFQVCLAEFSVPVVSNMSAVHNFSEQVPKIFPWYLGIGL